MSEAKRCETNTHCLVRTGWSENTAASLLQAAQSPAHTHTHTCAIRQVWRCIVFVWVFVLRCCMPDATGVSTTTTNTIHEHDTRQHKHEAHTQRTTHNTLTSNTRADLLILPKGQARALDENAERVCVPCR
jgi:hypothetical protein